MHPKNYYGLVSACAQITTFFISSSSMAASTDLGKSENKFSKSFVSILFKSVICFRVFAISRQPWLYVWVCFSSWLVESIWDLKNCTASSVLLYTSVFVFPGIRTDLMNIGIWLLNSVWNADVIFWNAVACRTYSLNVMNCVLYESSDTEELNKDTARLIFGFPTIYWRALSISVSKFVTPELMFLVFAEYVSILPMFSVFPITMKVTKDIAIVTKDKNTLAMQHSWPMLVQCDGPFRDFFAASTCAYSILSWFNLG